MSITQELKKMLLGGLPKSFEQRNLANPPQWVLDAVWGTGSTTKAGLKITELNAMQCSAVYASVRVLAETVASLPLFVYKRQATRGKERASNHPLYPILHHRANPLMTSFEFRETLMGHLALWGNAYAEIERNNSGIPVALWPLRPDRMRVEGKNQALQYFYTLPQGGEVRISSDNVFHVKGLSANGFVGQSPISFARESIGLSLAAEEFGSRFFSGDATPGGVLEHPGRLSKEAKDYLSKSWQDQHQGLSQAHRLAILEEGMKFQQIGIPGKDAQFLETRKFQVNEIARIFRIPPHMIGDLDRATFSNVEQQAIDFVVHTIRPWLVRWEQAILRDLFFSDELDMFFAEFRVDGLLRGDTQSRFASYAVGRQWGWLSADDVRELENMNPLPSGKGTTYLIPMNMIPAGSAPVAQKANGRDLTNPFIISDHNSIDEIDSPEPNDRDGQRD